MMGVNRWVNFSAEFTEFWNTVEFFSRMTEGVILIFYDENVTGNIAGRIPYEFSRR